MVDKYEMLDVMTVIAGLRNLSGNAQIDYLVQFKDTKYLKEILQYAYKPDLKYNINEAKLDKAFEDLKLKDSEKDPSLPIMDKTLWEGYKTALNELSSKKGVKEADVERLVATYFLPVDLKSRNLLRGILLKDLRINMGVKTFNKVWDDFDTKLQVQLANKFNGKGFNNPYYSRKLDGKRLYLLNCNPFSRTNKACSIAPIQHIVDELKTWDMINDVVLDGENLYFDENGKEDFQKGISLTSRDERTEDCKNICYVIFDMLPKEAFIKQIDYVPFKEEYKKMVGLIGDEAKITPCYSLIGTIFDHVYIARQDTDMKKLQELREKNNWEGLMVRDGDMPYQYKRTNSLLKLKAMQDNEFEIIGFKEGSGKYEGTLGTVTIKLSTGEAVDVGSGFSDDDRNYIWNNKDLILNSGYQLKVQYFEETKDKQGNNSLRFPVFKAFRKDNVEVMRIK